MPPIGIPIVSRSLPRYTVGAPRRESDLTQSGDSFLSGGMRLAKSLASKGPAIACSWLNSVAAAIPPNIWMNWRRGTPAARHAHEDDEQPPSASFPSMGVESKVFFST